MTAQHSHGEWSQEAALSSDFHNIRYITADGVAIASVRHRIGQDQDEALANARLLASSNKLLEHLANLAQAVELYATNGTDWPELIAANKLIEELGGK